MTDLKTKKERRKTKELASNARELICISNVIRPRMTIFLDLKKVHICDISHQNLSSSQSGLPSQSPGTHSDRLPAQAQTT